MARGRYSLEIVLYHDRVKISSSSVGRRQFLFGFQQHFFLILLCQADALVVALPNSTDHRKFLFIMNGGLSPRLHYGSISLAVDAKSDRLLQACQKTIDKIIYLDEGIALIFLGAEKAALEEIFEFQI